MVGGNGGWGGVGVGSEVADLLEGAQVLWGGALGLVSGGVAVISGVAGFSQYQRLRSRVAAMPSCSLARRTVAKERPAWRMR